METGNRFFSPMVAPVPPTTNNSYVIQSISHFTAIRKCLESLYLKNATMARHIGVGDDNFWDSSELAALKARTQALMNSQCAAKSGNLLIKSDPESFPQSETLPHSDDTAKVEAKRSEKQKPAARIPHDFTKKGFMRVPLLSRILNKPNRMSRLCTCPNCTSGLGEIFLKSDGTKRKIHICFVCGKTYGKTSHLTAHLRWHNNERPFQCSFQTCSKAFTRSDELQRHMRTHTGDKKFVCNFCNKRFTRSDHLNKHKKIHTSISPIERRATRRGFPVLPMPQQLNPFLPSLYPKTNERSLSSVISSADSGLITDHLNNLLSSADL